MASSPVTAPSSPRPHDSSPPPITSTNSTSSSLPPPSSSSPPPPPSSSPPPPSSPPPAPPTLPPPQPPISPPPAAPISAPHAPPPAPPISPPPAPPISPPPAPPTSSPPPREFSPPPLPSSPPPQESPPPPAQSQTPPPSASPSPPPPKSPPISPPPTSSILSPPSPSTAPFPTPPSPNSSIPPLPTFSPPPPTPTPPLQTPPSSSTTSSSPPPRSHAPAHRSPSSSDGSSASNASPPPSNSSSSNEVIIAEIAVAGVVLVLVFMIVFLVCLKKKKKQPYYMDPGRGTNGSEFYSSTTQWQTPHSVDHVVKLPPPPGVMLTPMGGPGGWAAAAPLPAAATTSTEFTSGFSGQHEPPSPNMVHSFSKCQFSYDELAAATGGFSQANLLGQGGFGYVHKGVLPDGKVVAVKSLKSGSGQGEREFQAEVEIISRVHHRHLVSLVGYCIAGGQRMLVYEFVSNKTLEFHLYGKGQPVMDWATRIRIAVGSAKGLGYLHEDCHPRIIHRDIKAANILLDNNFEAMVADFGLAKLSEDNSTHVSTRVMGTFGYLAPEYASSGKLTEKSDVFSFGVMLLELITGRRPVDLTNQFMEDSLVDWARPLLTKAMEDGKFDELVDPRLNGNYISHEMARMVACAAASIRHSARRRPRMSQIVRALDGDSSLEDLNEGVKPGQSSVYNSNGNSGHEAYDTGAYNADMMKFRKMVMSSQEFTSSEYGATSEYGLNPSGSSGESREMDHSGLQRQKL